MRRDIQSLKYESLEGFTDHQIREHHGVVYAGHVKRLNEVENKLGELVAAGRRDVLSLRELKTDEIGEKNAVKLHETYFAELGAGQRKPVGEIAKMIDKDFGSYGKWRDDFVNIAQSCRGWVVLAFDFDDNRLVNYGVASPYGGGVWNAIVLLAVDLSEHAYFLYTGANEATYVEAVMKNIDWDYINLAAHQYGIIERRKHYEKILA